jgi:hypothetical protein
MGEENLGKVVQRIEQIKNSNAMRITKTPQPKNGEVVVNRQGDRINLSE